MPVIKFLFSHSVRASCTKSSLLPSIKELSRYTLLFSVNNRMVTGVSYMLFHIKAGHAKSYHSKKLFIQILGTPATFTLKTVNTVDILKVKL